MKKGKIVSRITQDIGKAFCCFGGGQVIEGNPISVALKNKPYQFTAGVDVELVVESVLFEAGYDNLFNACKRDAELVDVAILGTPSGEYRNKLTEINILRLQAIK